MQAKPQPFGLGTSYLVLVRPEPPGQYTAQLVGLPEMRATAATREEAVRQVGHELNQWLASGRLVAIEAPQENPALKGFGRADAGDPLEQEFLEDLARFRQEDLEHTLREHDQGCPGSSSTPTT
jgi:hypothetical protein